MQWSLSIRRDVLAIRQIRRAIQGAESVCNPGVYEFEKKLSIITLSEIKTRMHLGQYILKHS